MMPHQELEKSVIYKCAECGLSNSIVRGDSDAVQES